MIRCKDMGRRLIIFRDKGSFSFVLRRAFVSSLVDNIHENASVHRRAFHFKQIRSLAARANVGHGIYDNDTLRSSSNLNEQNISVAQIKAAELELERMILSTNRILSKLTLDDIDGVDSLVNEVKVTMYYWISRWITYFHPYFALGPTQVNKGLVYSAIHHHNIENEESFGDYGPKTAERILRWVIHMDDKHPEYNFLNKVMSNLGNIVLGNIIEAYLLPCGTNMTSRERFHDLERQTVKSERSFVPLSSLTGTTNVDPSQWIPAMLQTLHMVDLMQALHQNPNNTLKQDTLSQNSILCALSKLLVLHSRCKQGIQWKSHLSNSSSLPMFCKFQSVQDIIHHMEQILESMEHSYKQTKNESIKPDTITYNHILGALARGYVPDASLKAQHYLERMEKFESLSFNHDEGLSHQSLNDILPALAFPDTGSYNLTIQALGSSFNLGQYYKKDELNYIKRGIASTAESIFQRIESRSKLFQREECLPNTITYSTVLSYYADAGMADKAEQMLKKMIVESKHSSTSQGFVEPNLICFNTCINAWAQTKGAESADNALKLLENMFEVSKIHPHLRPDTISFSSVISAFAKSNRLDAGDQAEQLLQRSIDLYKDGDNQCKPDSMTYNVVLEALSKQSKMEFLKHKPYSQTVKRAEVLFEDMHTLWRDGSSNVRPDTITYNIMLDMYGNLKETRKASAIFHKLIESDSMNQDIITFNSMLHALINSNDQSYMSKAMKMIEEMTYNDPTSPYGKLGIKPDQLSYNIVASGWAKKVSTNKNAIFEIEKLLSLFETCLFDKSNEFKPVNSLYNICIDAWAKSKDPNAISKCQRLFDRMNTLSNDLNEPSLCPDTVSYTTLINALATSQMNDAPYIAENLIQQMKEKEISPNLYTYSALVKCWSNSNLPQAAHKAVKILMYLKKYSDDGNYTLRPNSQIFTSVLNCIANSAMSDAGTRAEEILDLMDSLNQENLKPNEYTYTSVLKAWTKSGSPEAPQKAIEMLNRMESSGLEPTEACYNAAINAIAKSKSPTKAKKAEIVLDRLLSSKSAKPSINTYSTVINACAYTHLDHRGKNDPLALEAFDISKRCFRQVLQHHANEMNSVVFNTFLQSCNNLLAPGKNRDALVSSVFEKCCQSGLVNIQILVNLRKSLSTSALKRLLEGTTLADGNIQVEDIPLDWRLNAVENRRLERKQRK